MKFRELIVLLPCHSLEDFPLDYKGAQADGLLAAWSALWHPALIASAGSAPNWQRADTPPVEIGERLIVAPEVSHDRLPVGFVNRAQADGALLIRKCTSRAEIVAQALAGLDADVAGVNARIAADFLALGFCRLQVELLTRQMRYSSNIDETHFSNELVAGAQAAMRQDDAQAELHLRQCFDVLNESRKYFYPVDCYLIDLLLTNENTLGPELASDVERPTPTNLLITGELVQKTAAEQPATLAALQAALERGTLGLIGGEHRERELPLMPIESVLGNLVHGLDDFQQHLGQKPRVYGRRRYGLSPVLPQILTKLGFQGALHVTLDDGRFPLDPQSKTRWEGPGGSAIDTLTRLPHDAAAAATFLEYPRKLGESMDRDHVATLLFARWPGATSLWFDDLRRIAQYSSVLGKFVTVNDYFSQTDTPGRLSKFAPDEYRSPYLKQAIIRRRPDPVSHCQREHASAALIAATATVKAMEVLVRGRTDAAAAQSDASTTASGLHEEPCSQAAAAAAAALAAVIPRGTGAAAQGRVVVNPLSVSRRAAVDQAPAEMLVEVPPLGYAYLAPAGETRPAKSAKPIASGNMLRNEFCEVVIGGTLGGIQSIHDFKQRGNRLSQQIAFRKPGPAPQPGEVWRDPDVDAVYSVMAADEIQAISNGPESGEIQSRGRLLDQAGAVLATFRQTTRLRQHSRVIELHIALEPTELPRADPWNSYYAARFAWNDAGADLWRGVHLGREPTQAKHLESPDYVEIAGSGGVISLLSGGLPYHRRSGARMLDTLLITRGEQAREFSLRIGVDLQNSAAAALEMLSPPIVVDDAGRPPAANAAWFFHVNAKNVVATHWAPLITAGQVLGFRVRLLETLGKAGRVALRAFRSIDQARQVDFLGQPLEQLTIEDDRVSLDMAAYEWVDLEATWKEPVSG